MARQLIYTSSPRGLVSGRTGFVTVARHSDIRDRLVTELEHDSNYERSNQDKGGVVRRFTYYGGGEFWALTRIQDSGLDFTHRPCHLAHHLIGERDEPVRGSPLDWVRHWKGYRNEWKEDPRWLGEQDRVAMDRPDFEITAPRAFPEWLPGGAEFWSGLARSASARPIFLYPAGREDLLFEAWEWALSHVAPTRQWRISFTTRLQSSEDPSRYLWVAGFPGSAAEQLARREPARLINLITGEVSESLIRQVCHGELDVAGSRESIHWQSSSDSAHSKKLGKAEKIARPGIGKPTSAATRQPITLPEHELVHTAGSRKGLFLVGGVAALLIIGVLIWVLSMSRDTDENHPDAADKPATWEPVIITGASQSLAQLQNQPEATVRVDFAKQWQELGDTPSYVAVEEFVRTIKQQEPDSEYLHKAVQWMNEKQKLQQELNSLLDGLEASLDNVGGDRSKLDWSEEFWHERWTQLPVEWQPAMASRKERLLQRQTVMRLFPEVPVRFLIGRGTEWELDPGFPENVHLADTVWSLGKMDRFPNPSEDTIPLQLVRTAARYPQFLVAYDIFSILRIEELWREGQTVLTVHAETLSAELFRQNSQLLLLQRPHAYIVKANDGKGTCHLVIWKGTRVSDFKFPAHTIDLQVLLEPNHIGPTRLAGWMTPLLEKFGTNFPESGSHGKWFLRNSLGVQVDLVQTPEQGFLLKINGDNVQTDKKNGAFSAVKGQSAEDNQSQISSPDTQWLLKRKPWKLQFQDAQMDEPITLLTFD